MKNLNDRENNEMLFPTILKKIQSENVKTESQPLVKYHSFDQKKPTEKMDFKVLWVLNRLSKMQLDMNLCYFLLEKQNCETIEPEKLLNVVLFAKMGYFPSFAGSATLPRSGLMSEYPNPNRPWL